jgi:NAD(P)-dependent dehydrogenase (short-subunit alcohol dehydrogenase family)
MHLLETSNLTPSALAGRVAVVTGAGRGVGFETARALAWLGAHVVIAEIDELTGARAAREINEEMARDAAVFVWTDVGDEESLGQLVKRVTDEFSRVEIVVNNATVTPFGPVVEAPLADWDLSYRVNVRGPATLARLTVPMMLRRQQHYGVFVTLSSVGGPFMAPYEAMKAAGVELAVVLAAELEGTDVRAFSIGPGQVMTPGLVAGVEKLAPLYGLSADEFLDMNAANSISAEEAGTGIAAAIAYAERFHGTETAAVAGLAAADIGTTEELPARETPYGDLTEAGQVLRDVRTAFAEQIDAWHSRGVFERKWMERHFRKQAGIGAEEMLEGLDELAEGIQRGEPGGPWRDLLPRLRAYYDSYMELARGNVRDGEVLRTQLQIIGAWQERIDELITLLEG